jgi:hypothetical protein
MPGKLVHLGEQVQCAHLGQAQPTVTSTRVLVDNQPIVTLGSPYVVAGCTLPPPIIANGPCVTAQFLSGATRIVSEGKPVLLQDSPSLCAPTGTPLLILPTQIRVIGA